MAVVGNLFVNIAAKTADLSKGIAGAIAQLQKLPYVGRLTAIGLSSAMIYEFGRIARMSLLRFAETRQSIYDITKAFRTLELSAARSMAPTLNVLTGMLATDLNAWAKESSEGISGLGTTFGFLGGIIQGVYNGFKIMFQGVATGIAALSTGLAAIIESLAWVVTLGNSDFTMTKDLAGATANLERDLSNSVYDMGQQPSAYQAGVTGKVDGKTLTETGTLGSEALLMIARKQVTLLESINQKVGGVR